MDDYVDHLLSYVPREKVKTFTYGHVIPKDNLIAIPVARGMDNVEFNFTFDQRQSEKMVCNITHIDPGLELIDDYRSPAWAR